MINEDFNVNEIYVFVADCPGGGIVGEKINIEGQEAFIPFVCSSQDKLNKMKIMAINISTKLGIKIKVLKFTNKEEIGMIG